MTQKKEIKWYEDIFLSLLFACIGVMILFNGFSAISTQFLTEQELTRPSKQKAMLSIISWLETTWWKYPIICFFFLATYLAAIAGIKKYKSKSIKAIDDKKS